MGAAIVRMPSLVVPPRNNAAAAADDSSSSSAAGQLDYGFYCSGCHKMRLQFEQRTLPAHVAAQLFPPTLKDRRRAMDAIALRLWSTQGFIEHVGKCYGAQILLQSMRSA
ncbi:hypothetical protein MAPG_00822 [Magnaporthiopsis poae ATCC 64411]|uniref:Uncharacterized protein n=1 Tax=Magnaporthiopsis poae (strain ATCC 64411 / 73-15) TaxID=644358 RepID=A0A0C4DM22_MAGP6|nr:hypothetical protein MAPG_00822 [Magnaporthiopsis poae ATCC 64411]